MKINYRDPSIKLATHSNYRKEAWQRSRPFMEVDDKEMEMVKVADLPVNSFITYVFEIDSSILFRDLLFTFRGIHPWATSFRQLKSTPDNTLMSSEYKDNEDQLEKLLNHFYDLQDQGLPQDYTKQFLPMATSAQFSVVIDHRSLIAIIKTFRDANEFLYEVYGKMFLDAIGMTEEELDESYVKSILDTVVFNRNDYELLDSGEVSKAGDFVAGAWSLKGNIMAQVIRMHQATVKNSLWNTVVIYQEPNELAQISCDIDVDVAIYASSNVFERTAITRVAWFGQWDNEDSGWSPIVGSYVKDMTPQEFWEFAGLENGNDKNVANMMGAVEGKEAHPPSPVLLEKPDLVPFRLDKYKSNSVIAKKWKEVYDAGLINDNPDNEYRKIYEDAIERNGYPE